LSIPCTLAAISDLLTFRYYCYSQRLLEKLRAQVVDMIAYVEAF